MCGEGDSPNETVRRSYPKEQMSDRAIVRENVLLDDDLVGSVTSGHVTKMAVTPFDPLPKTLCYTHSSQLSLQ